MSWCYWHELRWFWILVQWQKSLVQWHSTDRHKLFASFEFWSSDPVTPVTLWSSDTRQTDRRTESDAYEPTVHKHMIVCSKRACSQRYRILALCVWHMSTYNFMVETLLWIQWRFSGKECGMVLLGFQPKIGIVISQGWFDCLCNQNRFFCQCNESDNEHLK